MNLQNQIARLEDRLGRGDEPCPDHQTTFIKTAGDPEPAESRIPPCLNCGRPGAILEIIHVIVDRNADGALVETQALRQKRAELAALDAEVKAVVGEAEAIGA
jgi:hypothetical protein